MTEPLQDTLAILAAHGIAGPIDAAIVLGTGLGGLADAVPNAVRIPYSAVPGFPASGVSGHAGALIFGILDGKRVLMMQGRAHYYEHGDARTMRMPIAIMAALRARMIVLTNSAGSLHEATGPGVLVSISDHINYAGINPLIGETSDQRFVSMTDAYDPQLRAQLLAAAHRANVPLTEGVYMWFSGPSFETPAEIRMARSLGADLVGMSTVPEIILARYFGLRVVAISMVTNLAAGIQGASPTHAETKEIAGRSAENMLRLLRQFLKDVCL
ncbi:MAG: purine-nucleoside phosphorylase [Beijerinckiaceae bacterium]